MAHTPHEDYMHFCLYLFVLRPVNDDSNDECRLNKKIGNVVKMLFYLVKDVVVFYMFLM